MTNSQRQLIEAVANTLEAIATDMGTANDAIDAAVEESSRVRDMMEIIGHAQSEIQGFESRVFNVVETLNNFLEINPQKD